MDYLQAISLIAGLIAIGRLTVDIIEFLKKKQKLSIIAARPFIFF
jgi:hypothetical protein